MTAGTAGTIAVVGPEGSGRHPFVSAAADIMVVGYDAGFDAGCDSGYDGSGADWAAAPVALPAALDRGQINVAADLALCLTIAAPEETPGLAAALGGALLGSVLLLDCTTAERLDEQLGNLSPAAVAELPRPVVVALTRAQAPDPAAVRTALGFGETVPVLPCSAAIATGSSRSCWHSSTRPPRTCSEPAANLQ